MTQLSLSKIDSARRQIETAIRLYFHEGDPVSIHTLVGASYQLLLDLSKRRGEAHMFVKGKALEWIRPEFQREFLAHINAAENFFKHADRDPDDMLAFDTEQSEWLLLDCCETYRSLAGERLPLLAVFQLWSWMTWMKPFIEDAAFERARTSLPGAWGQITTRQDFFARWLPIASAAGVFPA